MTGAEKVSRDKNTKELSFYLTEKPSSEATGVTHILYKVKELALDYKDFKVASGNALETECKRLHENKRKKMYFSFSLNVLFFFFLFSEVFSFFSSFYFLKPALKSSS